MYPEDIALILDMYSKRAENKDADTEKEQYISRILTKMELAELRKSKGLSQKELSALSGLSVQCISDIENSSSGNPTLKSITRYLDSLGYEMLFRKKVF